MEKKGTSCPKNMCKKICKAFNASPTFRRIRRISYSQNQSEFTSTIKSNPKSTNKKANPADFVPITYDYSTQTSSQFMPKAAVGQNPEAKSQLLRKPDGESGVHIEDRFTEFINIARIKIGHFPNSEEHKVSSGKNQKLSEICSMKDMFSDYIDRTKKQLGSTLDIGVGKTNSFK